MQNSELMKSLYLFWCDAMGQFIPGGECIQLWCGSSICLTQINEWIEVACVVDFIVFDVLLQCFLVWSWWFEQFSYRLLLQICLYLSVMSKFLLLSSTFALECMRMGASRDFMYSCASCFVSVFALQVLFSTTDPKKEVFLTAKLQNTFRTTGAAWIHDEYSMKCLSHDSQQVNPIRVILAGVMLI